MIRLLLLLAACYWPRPAGVLAVAGMLTAARQLRRRINESR